MSQASTSPPASIRSYTRLSWAAALKSPVTITGADRSHPAIVSPISFAERSRAYWLTLSRWVLRT